MYIIDCLDEYDYFFPTNGLIYCFLTLCRCLRLENMMADKQLVVKVVISKEELDGIKNKLSCTQPGCSKYFTSSSNLSMHLWKSHKLEDKNPMLSSSEKSDVQYHCPVEKCKYNKDLGRFFPRVKLLKQVINFIFCRPRDI